MDAEHRVLGDSGIVAKIALVPKEVLMALKQFLDCGQVLLVLRGDGGVDGGQKIVGQVEAVEA
eukprot:60466-Rhodomonas_salina.1